MDLINLAEMTLLGFYFLYFFCTSNKTITLFYKWTKILDKLIKPLSFLFLFFLLWYSFSPLFIKANPPWLIFESIKVIEIKTSMLFNVDFANNTILSCFFLFLNYWLILFNSSSYCINFKSYCRTHNSYRNTKQGSKSRNWNTCSKWRS